MSTIDLKVPDIGDFDEVDVIEVLVAVGDTIAVEQSLITVESDKASMEIPAEQGGVIKAVLVKVGDKIAQGKAIVQIEAEAKAADAPAPAAPNAGAAASQVQPAAAAAPAAAPQPAASFSGQADGAYDVLVLG
ncbi:MAG: dihydrolipoyl dehydrogenase, partial [Alcaligenaceae bacterium]|nr:dihydrolipoyl dehydrogenase [Alcaligenaceae bacterium]